LTPKGVRAIEHNCSNSACLWADELGETRDGGLGVHGDLLATRTRAVDAGDIAGASEDAKRYPRGGTTQHEHGIHFVPRAHVVILDSGSDEMERRRVNFGPPAGVVE
jgi:hypothetical protein